MAIERGIYIIRRDIIGIDNVFASGVTFEAPVIGLPFQDGDANVQRWEVRRVEDDLYIVTKPEFLPGPPGGFAVNDIHPDERSCLGNLPTGIQAARGPIGAIYAIDLTNTGNKEELVLKPFPVVRDPPTLPGWIFTPVNEN